MSSKFLHTISEEPNLEKRLEKQIGCMASIFQIFDRHPFLGVKRLHGQKRITTGRMSTGNEASKPQENVTSVVATEGVDSHHRSSEGLKPEPNSRSHSRTSSIQFESEEKAASCFPAAVTKTPMDQKHRKSSSTRDSSPRLSVDNLGNTPVLCKEMPRYSLDSRQSPRASVDIRDAVRDSIYKNLSIDTTTKSEDKSQSKERKRLVLKPKDSPRPQPLQNHQQSVLNSSPKVGQKPISTSQGMSRAQTDLDESLRVLAKLTELPWNNLEHSREGYPFVRDSPRFSYDGREIPRSSSFKIKDPPRFSLDSKDAALRSADQKPKPCGYDSLEAERKRSPSVVARLMGLDEMPSECCTPTNTHKRTTPNSPSAVEKFRYLAEATKRSTPDSPKQSAMRLDSRMYPDSPKTSGYKGEKYEDSSPRTKNTDLVLKPILTQRCNMAPAPWKQQEGSSMYPRKAFESQKCLSESPRRNNERPPHVLYGEIEKRLKQLELNHCGKDLNKQILEAMQHKGLLNYTKEKQFENDVLETHDQKFRLGNPNSRAFDAPIVLIKPAKMATGSSHLSQNPKRTSLTSHQTVSNIKRASMISQKTTKDHQSGRMSSSSEASPAKHHRRELSSNNKLRSEIGLVEQRGRCSISPPSSPSLRNPQTGIPSVKVNSPTSPGKLQRNKLDMDPTSPGKLQRNKLDMERKSRQSSPSKSPGSLSKQSSAEAENSSPRSQARSMQIDVGSKKCQEADNAPLDSKRRGVSHLDGSAKSCGSKVAGFHRDHNCKEALGSKIKQHYSCTPEAETPPRTKCKFDEFRGSRKKQEEENTSEADECHLNFSEELSSTSTSQDVLEQPSPISVLDVASFDREDPSPSPVKKCLIAFKDDESRQYRDNLHSSNTWSSFAYELVDGKPVPINTKLLDNVTSLVQKLESLSSSQQISIPVEENLHEDQDSQVDYVKEILLSSGLLSKGYSFLGSSHELRDFSLSPGLFHILEQKRIRKFEYSTKHCQDRVNRKLLFDSVSEVLGKKSHDHYLQSSQPWLLQNHKTYKTASTSSLDGQKLLEEVYEELAQLESPCFDNDSGNFDVILQKDLSKEIWESHEIEIGEVALDIEKMLFKDLVNETLLLLGHHRHGTSTEQNARRQLFFH